LITNKLEDDETNQMDISGHAIDDTPIQRRN